MINQILSRNITSDDIALGEIRRLTFAFKLSGKALTLPTHLDDVIEVFNAFNRERDFKKFPDNLVLKFEVFSNKKVDVAALYPQLREFLDPFITLKIHTPALLINSHHTVKKQALLTLEFTWQDKTYEQYIRRPNPNTWETKL